MPNKGVKKIETVEELMAQEKVYESYACFLKTRYSTEEERSMRPQGRVHNKGWFQNWSLFYAYGMVKRGVLFTVEEKNEKKKASFSRRNALDS